MTVPTDTPASETPEPTDADFLEKARRGDLDAFEALVARHERRIYTLARRITGHDQDAEDVTQQTFLGAVEHLEDFRGDASFATWIHRIATYAALKILRKRREIGRAHV